jgi:hypothetical protein
MRVRAVRAVAALRLDAGGDPSGQTRTGPLLMAEDGHMHVTWDRQRTH